MTTADETKQPNKPKGGTSLFWLVYGQIAALLGALSMLVFIGHFVDVGLKGVIRDAVEWWIENVRPAVGYPLQWMVNQMPEAWRFEISPLLKDYFGVGFVVALSYLRASTQMLGAWGPFRVLNFIAGILVWPMLMIGVAMELARSWFWNDMSPELLPFVGLFVAPVFYLGLLFAANAWLV